jgi:hypothetical protein
MQSAVYASGSVIIGVGEYSPIITEPEANVFLIFFQIITYEIILKLFQMITYEINRLGFYSPIITSLIR